MLQSAAPRADRNRAALRALLLGAANLAIAAVKLGTAAVTGSASMLDVAQLRLPFRSSRQAPAVEMIRPRLRTQDRPQSAGRWLAGVNRQLSVEGSLVGGPRFAAGDISSQVWVFVQNAR